ncbi:MAG: 4Fe-4S dicluster domain-containing protein, partial [[Ruminococcus] faecis]|nr:4Fe-4S dicluster domain-containing protein [Mediterraneibacter faecis]
HTCGSCGLCAAKCPSGAIPSDNPKQTDKDKCISCMRCISVCPTHSRKLNPLMLAAASQKLKKACSGRKENELFL